VKLKAAAFEAVWVRRGYFDLQSRVRRDATFSKLVTDELRKTTSVTKVAGYPVRAKFRHSLYWREGNVNYAEAQFFATISHQHALLSLGVSVEKGVEAGTGEQRLNRQTWDWRRVVRLAPELVAVSLPRLAEQLSRPLSLWLLTARGNEERESRTFVFDGGQWFQRYSGGVRPEAITRAITQVDKWGEAWVNLHVGYDLTAEEAGKLDVAAFARRLSAFDGVRRLLRGRS
jgi:hypothetical protein